MSKLIIGVNPNTVGFETMKESGKGMMNDGFSLMLCTNIRGREDSVLVGRTHVKDENGDTTYEYGELIILNAEQIRQEQLENQSTEPETTEPETKPTEPETTDPETEPTNPDDTTNDTKLPGRQPEDSQTEIPEWKIVLGDVIWKEAQSEKNSSFECDAGAVFVGRKHVGDENGKTEMAYRRIYVEYDGNIYPVTSHFNGEQKLGDKTSENKDDAMPMEVKVESESDGTSARYSSELSLINTVIPVGYYAPMISRSHQKDENGPTQYKFALFEFDTDSINKSDEKE